jgi:outer membrane protein assembly factor BamB
MWRSVVFAVFFLFTNTFLMISADPSPAAESPLISETASARYGLTRSWFAQAEMDPGRSRLSHMVLFDGTLYIQSDRGLVQALDAETGAALWSKQIGQPDYPSFPLGVGKYLLAVVNGSRLYVLDRRSGELLQEQLLDGVPGAGPAVSDQHVYVPLLPETIVAYGFERIRNPGEERQEREKKVAGRGRKAAPALESAAAASPETPSLEPPPAATPPPENFRFRPDHRVPPRCQMKGRAVVQPLILHQSRSEEFVAWPTDAGCLAVCRLGLPRAESLELRYRLETAAPITVPAAYLPPDPQIDLEGGLVITASTDGSLTAILEQNGKLLWRTSLGEPIVTPPAVLGDRVYAAAQRGGLYCLEVKTGKQEWFAPGALQFVAQSKTRVYASDLIGRLLILDAANGARLGMLPTEALSLKLSNTVSDRIYLASPAGLIQCLHELEQKEPIRYDQARHAALAPKIQQKGIEPSPPKGKQPAPQGSGKKTEEEKNPFEEQ